MINYYITDLANSTLSNIAGTQAGTVAFSDDQGTSDSLYTVGVNKIKTASGIHPVLYFKYVKKKFQFLEKIKLDRRIKSFQAAFDKAVDNGQEMLAEKLMAELLRETKEIILYAKGITRYIERDDLMRYKTKLRDGHISDTLFKNYTRLIPDDVLEKKKKYEKLFDDFVIFHYWDEKKKDVAKMSPEEKTKMKDPILFGLIKETNRLYFVTDWIDEHCDLTFEKLMEVVGKSNVGKLTAKSEFAI